jgi:hypothetical protein
VNSKEADMEFEATSGFSGREARRCPNHIVSFLSHNRVLM